MKKHIILLTLLYLLPFMLEAQVDLALNPNAVSLVSPNDDCMLTSNEQITIVIVNQTGTTLSFNVPFDINYSLNGGTLITETGQINAGTPNNATYIFTFSMPDDFSACQIHTLDFTLTLTGGVTDTDLSNNTATRTIISDCAPTLGSITGPGSVCQNNNSGNLTLSGYNGTIQNWEFSTDMGTTWTGTGNNTDTEPYTNISQETWYRVILGSLYGLCPNDTTPYEITTVDLPSDGGNLIDNQNVCDNGNNGMLVDTGYVGTVIDWQYSTDGGITWNNIGYTDDTLLFSNVLTTTQYQVEVQNGSCPSDFSSIAELTVIAGSDAGNIIGEDTVCNAMADSLLSISAYYGNIQEWIYSSDSGATWVSTGQSSLSFSYQQLLGYTIFGVIVQELNCPTDTAFHPIVVLPTNVSGGPNLTITEGDTVQLFGTGGVSYYWTPSNYITDVNAQEPMVWPPTDMTYSVEVTDQYNCKDTAFVLITVEPDLTKIVVPSLMTPNGDGINDIWNIENITAYDEAKVYVFDAYGQVIFYSSPYNNDWDATFNNKPLPDGTYFYLIELSPDFKPIKGSLTILTNK
ncbi:MAG TPA: gliding motility-associated C-terminal domain-containing protein [Crocinitomix sp.]|nr:gliding motility-associated C-terminal domain-containing protein [Crocinitomix sp.]